MRESAWIVALLLFFIAGCDQQSSQESSQGEGGIYDNPIDGETYVADWKTYEPEGGVRGQEGTVSNVGIRFLSSEDQLSKNVNVTRLSGYVLNVEAQLESLRKEKVVSGKILLQIELSKSNPPKYSISHQGKIDKEFLQQLHDKLSALEDYRTLVDEIQFQIEFSIKEDAVFVPSGSQDDVVPEGFVGQVMEPLGGKIWRPKDWFYAEAHNSRSWTWIISKENTNGGEGRYDTGVRIQVFMGIKEGINKSPETFIKEFYEQKKKEAQKIHKTCEVEDHGMFSRICLETDEGEYRILYSLFWGNDMDLAVVSIAGAKKENWDTYADTFDEMSRFELINMKRFESKGDKVPAEQE